MDSQEILKSLSNLEKTLQGIESARQQVERTVNAYEGAKAQLSTLTQDFTSIYQELNNVLTAIQNSKNLVSGEVSDKADEVFKELQTRASSLEQVTKTIKDDFVSSCNATSDSFSKSIAKSEKDLLDMMTANINNVRQQTTKEIEKVSGIVTAFNTAVSELQENYKLSLSSSVDDQKSLLNQVATEFSRSVEQYIVSMRNVKNDMESILERYNTASSRVEEKMTQLETEIKTSIDKFETDLNEKSNAILNSNNTIISKIGEQIESVNSELQAKTDKISSEISSSSAANKDSAKNINDKIDFVASQLLEANAKSNKLIVFLIVGLLVSIILNILAIVKVI